MTNKIIRPKSYYSKTDWKNYYSQLKAAGKLIGTIKDAIKKHNKRIKNQPFNNPISSLKQRLSLAKILIPLGCTVENQVKHLAYKKYPRRQNWINPKPTTSKPVKGWTVNDINCGRYSSSCTYTRWQYQPEVTSYAIILDRQGKKIRYNYWTHSTIIKAPHGYFWDRDINGLRLVSKANKKDDFHPEMKDLLSGSRHLAAKVRENARTRIEIAKKDRETKTAIKKAEREGVMICLADSLKAGNCRVGSLNFAQRHNLDITKHYKPTKLLKIANGDSDRVRLAVVAGLRRHRQEMLRGYSIIAEHHA